MSEARYFRVGLFVLMGIVLITSGALILGGGSLFEDSVVMETVFDESVQGLEVGSPVQLRGVHVGSVSEIALAQDLYEEAVDTQQALFVVVRMKIAPRGGEAGDEAFIEEAGERIRRFEKRGLRVQLISSPLTGITYIEANIHSADAPTLPIRWKTDHIYIPSTPSTIEAISSAVERIFKRFEDAELDVVVANFDRLITNLADATDGLELDGLEHETRRLVQDLRITVRRVNAAVAKEGDASMVARANKALDGLTRTVTRLERMLEGGRYDFEVALENLRVTSENLRELSETAREYPSLLLLGKPPKPSEAVAP